MNKLSLSFAIALACGTVVAEEEFPVTVGTQPAYSGPTYTNGVALSLIHI